MKKYLFFLICLFIHNYGYSQTLINEKKSLDSINNKTPAHQLDIIDIFSKIFAIKGHLATDSAKIKPGRILLSVVPAIGYTISNGGIASINVNSSFYTAFNANLSVIEYSIQYSSYHQIIFPIIGNIWLKDNKLDLLSDWRYYKYPSLTYGLGGYTTRFISVLTNYSYLRIYQELLRHFSSFYFIGLGYDLDNHFNIQEEGNATDFGEYNNGALKTISSGPVFHIKYDNRKNINNPKNAFYLSVIYRINQTWTGSTQNWQSLQIESRKYMKISPHSVVAFWSWNTFTFEGKAPYLDLPSTAWDTYLNTGRGYVQGRFRGPGMIYDELEYRFRITKNDFLGGVIFTNAETVSEYPNDQFAKIEPANGVGLRVKFNKFSDVNVCIDYGVGTQGSKGFFFNLGEVF